MVFGGANARAEFALGIVPMRFEEQAKVSVLFSPENILVFDGAVTVESFSTFWICYLSDFICRKYFVRFGVEHQFAASSNRDHAFVRIGWQPNVEFCVNWVVKNTGCINNLNHFSRRLAGVNQFDMRRITIRRALTWHFRKMHPCVEQSNGLVPLSLFPSWPGCITNTSGYDFRKGQV
jgi:hypothetical protein